VVGHATDSNWSSGLTIQDRLLGTLRTIRARAPIGVPGCRDGLSLRDALALPFRAQQNRLVRFARQQQR
jgi:hypothetical protein